MCTSLPLSRCRGALGPQPHAITTMLERDRPPVVRAGGTNVRMRVGSVRSVLKGCLKAATRTHWAEGLTSVTFLPLPNTADWGCARPVYAARSFDATACCCKCGKRGGRAGAPSALRASGNGLVASETGGAITMLGMFRLMFTQKRFNVCTGVHSTVFARAPALHPMKEPCPELSMERVSWFICARSKVSHRISFAPMASFHRRALCPGPFLPPFRTNLCT